MAGHLNKACIIGNLGGDPEIRDVNGQSIANFSVATTESWKDKQSGEKKERTEWHRIVVWNEAMVINVIEKYLKKGSRVYLEGQLQTRQWEKEGQKHYSTEIVLSGFDAKLLLLGDASGGGSRDPNDNASRPGNGGGRGGAAGESSEGRADRNSYADAKGRSQPKAREGNFSMDDEIPF